MRITSVIFYFYTTHKAAAAGGGGNILSPTAVAVGQHTQTSDARFLCSVTSAIYDTCSPVIL